MFPVVSRSLLSCRGKERRRALLKCAIFQLETRATPVPTASPQCADGRVGSAFRNELAVIGKLQLPWTAYVYIGVGIYACGWSTMDKLPIELTQRIFSLLEYRALASAAKVCRTWRHLTDQAELWKRLYERRWGPDKGAKSCLDVSSSQSWKAAYEVEDRWERIGEDMTFVREGNDYFLAQKGLLLRYLGSSHKLDQRVAGGVMSSRENRESGTGTSTSSSAAPGLLDKLIQFVADLDYEHRRVTKRAHTVHDGGVV